MSFDIRRATKDQLDKINADIKAGKSGKNYTIHQSGGLDFILIDSSDTPECQEQFEISKGVSAMSKEKTSIEERANVIEIPSMNERVDNADVPLEFNFESL